MDDLGAPGVIGSGTAAVTTNSASQGGGSGTSLATYFDLHYGAHRALYINWDYAGIKRHTDAHFHNRGAVPPRQGERSRNVSFHRMKVHPAEAVVSTHLN